MFSFLISSKCLNEAGIGVTFYVIFCGIINDLNGNEIIGTYYEKEFQKTSQQAFRIEKVIKRKGIKLYVKWKGYENLFNSWIDKNDIE